MHYLIDGHNLIGKMPDIELDDPIDELKLILRLRSWTAAKRRRQVTVYFDHGLPGGKDKALSTGPVKVVFATSGRTADALLIAHMKQVRNAGAYTLVSSDAAILRVAKARKLRQMRSEKFALQLALPKPAKRVIETPDTAVDPQQSEAEIAEWLELFGPVPERPVPERPVVKRRTPLANPQENSNSKPKKQKSKRVDEDMKHGRRVLTEDDLQEWLRLFGE